MRQKNALKIACNLTKNLKFNMDITYITILHGPWCSIYCFSLLLFEDIVKTTNITL